HLWGVGDRRHDVRLAAAGARRPAVELLSWELGILARHPRYLGDVPRSDGAWSAAALHADGRQRVVLLGQRNPALLVGADVHRHLDGPGHVAPGLRPHEDVARRAVGVTSTGMR